MRLDAWYVPGDTEAGIVLDCRPVKVQCSICDLGTNTGSD